jgi:hypothetical protein
VKQEAIYSFQAMLLAMIYWSYRSMFIDLHFVKEFKLTDKMQAMLDRGVKDYRAILKQHSKLVFDMFLIAKKDLLSPSMVVLFHKILSFPEKKHSASTCYPNVMHMLVLRDIEATAKHYLKEIECDIESVGFNHDPDPIFPSDILDAPDIPQGLLPPELVSPQPTSNDSRLASATSASTPIKSNASKGPNVDDQDDTFDNQDDISVGSGNTGNSRFSGSEFVLNAATLPTETSSSIKRRKSGSSSQSSSDGVHHSSPECSPNKKKAKSSTKAKKTSPKKPKKSESKLKKQCSKLSSSCQKKSGQRSTTIAESKPLPERSPKKQRSKLSSSSQKKSGQRSTTIEEGEPLPAKSSSITIDGKFMTNDSNVRPDLITDEVMQQNWIEAQKNPEMGLHYINTFGEVVEIRTSTNVRESMPFKEQMGIVSRKDKDFKEENPDYVQFKGNPTPLNSVPIFALASPSFLKDCPLLAARHSCPPHSLGHSSTCSL